MTTLVIAHFKDLQARIKEKHDRWQTTRSSRFYDECQLKKCSLRSRDGAAHSILVNDVRPAVGVWVGGGGGKGGSTIWNIMSFVASNS